MTTGQLMVYTGIALIAAGVLTVCLYISLFAGQRKKLERKIMEDYV